MTPGEVETIFRDEAGRALATLIRVVRDFDLAEDVLQEAFAAALQRWPTGGVSSNPRAWLVNVGRNKAIIAFAASPRFAPSRIKSSTKSNRAVRVLRASMKLIRMSRWMTMHCG